MDATAAASRMASVLVTQDGVMTVIKVHRLYSFLDSTPDLSTLLQGSALSKLDCNTA